MYSSTLKHYGVKGMKWGVRRDDDLVGGKHARVLTRYSYDDGTPSRENEKIGRHSEQGRQIQALIDEGRYKPQARSKYAAAEKFAFDRGKAVVYEDGKLVDTVDAVHFPQARGAYKTMPRQVSAGRTYVDDFDFSDFIDLDDLF